MVRATELAREGARVNCILPYYVDTLMSAAINISDSFRTRRLTGWSQMMSGHFRRTPEIREAIKTLMPSGRVGLLEEDAEAIHFLCSPRQASSMTMDW